MGEPQHVGATFLADVFGSSTTCPVFICSLINGDAREGSVGAGERFVTTRTPEYISAFARKWDIARRGVFWCVSTVTRDARRRAKETLAELNCLHADIDFKDLDEDPETVRRVLAGLRYPPSIVTASGNGLHPLWLFKEALEATPATIADVEQLLRRLTDLLGADPSAAECARLLRLPGTHNSKGGGWTEVTIETYHPTLRYGPDDLQDWLELAPQPLLHRHKSAGNGQSPDNPFLAVARRQGFKPTVDVAARLAAMRYQGARDSGIHLTQLAISASLLNHGESIDDVIALLLEATRAAAGEAGQRWNWAREERDLRGMCEDWLAKHPEIAAAEPSAVEPSGPGPGATGDKARAEKGDDAGAGGTGAGAGAGTGAGAGAGAKPRRTKTGKRTYGEIALIIADGVIDDIRRDGGDLLLTEGELHRYRDGLWSSADDAIEQELRVLIQKGADVLATGNSLSLLNAAWKRLTEHPALYRAHVEWDAAGKVCLTNGVLDLITRTFGPWTPGHFLRRKLGVAYDPTATAPRVKQFLAELFADRELPLRTALIDLLQEFTGAALCVRLLHREQRRALFLVGPSRTGKSELARLLRHLFGASIASPSIADLNDRFGLEVFYRATAWIRDDAINEGDKLSPQHFKVIVTGEPADIRRMYKGAAPVELAIPIVLTVNALPVARDASNAVFNRSLVIDMTRVFDEAIAIEARRKIGVPPGRWLGDWLAEQEGPGFLNWALEGLARLLKQGAFVIPEPVLDAIQRFQREGDVVVDFARTALVRSDCTKVTRADVVCAFHGWRREDEGDGARLYGARWLIPKLRTACPWAIHRPIKGVRYLCGVKLTEEALKLWARQATAAAQGGRGAEGSSTNKDEVNQPWNSQEPSE